MLPHILRWVLVATALLAPLAARQACAQARVNPDISAIGDMRYIYRDNVARQLAGTNGAAFDFHELELNLSGYLNPYARADVFIAVHGVTGPVELEEVYGSVVRGVPFNLQFRFGKYFSNFSRLLSQHPHQFSWLDRPLMHTAVFGPDGAPLIGARATRLFGIGDTAVTLSADAFRSDFFELDGGHGEEAQPGHSHGNSGGIYEIGYMGHAAVFRELTENTWFDFGGSYMWAEYDPEHNLNTNIYGVDAKIKWRPDVYKGVDLVAEVQLSDREVEKHDTETITNTESLGAFAAGEVKFMRRFDTGLFYDFAQDPGDESIATTGAGAWFAFMPAEESLRFSLVYRHEVSDLYDGTSNMVTLQVLFGLGPHQPHPF